MRAHARTRQSGDHVGSDESTSADNERREFGHLSHQTGRAARSGNHGFPELALAGGSLGSWQRLRCAHGVTNTAQHDQGIAVFAILDEGPSEESEVTTCGDQLVQQ